ncbi:MAG TPA: hypothetical protein PKL77_06595 [Candidatus Omnitrophota bacterium]|nr:hypothetical protein [Candidatus Omnitrophota bacterium]HPT07933.1 hypothetical protein [Candidatus Omnitrophota bacterium]
MRRVLVLTVASLAIITQTACAAVEFKVFDMRNRLFEESKEIKTLIAKSKDSVVLMGMFDSCMLSMAQLDAYFSMLGIFYSVKDTEGTLTALNFLSSWINEMSRTNAVVLTSFDSSQIAVEKKTQEHLAKLKSYYVQFNTLLDGELKKVTVIKLSVAKSVQKPVGPDTKQSGAAQPVKEKAKAKK